MAEFPFPIVGFDLDGTLLDTHADLGAAVNHALSLAGRPPVPIGEMPRLIGGGTRKMLGRALERSGGRLDEASFDRLYADLLDYYRRNIAEQTRPYPGAEAVLDGLAMRGVKLAVVSNKLESLTRQLLGELGLTDRFATIIGGDSLGVGRGKPQPDSLYEMLARLGDSAAAFVGDTTYDVRAARAAGLPVVAVSFGFHDVPPEELGADAVIDHFDELVPVLERLSTG